MYSIIKSFEVFALKGRHTTSYLSLNMSVGCDCTCLFLQLFISSLTCAAFFSLVYQLCFLDPPPQTSNSPFFFCSLLFLLPSPENTLDHFDLSSLSVSHGMASICATGLSDNTWWTTSESHKATAKEQQCYSAMNRSFVPEEILVY